MTLPQQRGPAAEDIAQLWWIYLLVGIAVYVLVLVLLVIPWLRRRRDPHPTRPGCPDG